MGVVAIKDLLVNSNGDIEIKNHDLQLVRDKQLTAQKVRLILGTNKGEWLLNEDEGINFRVILTKNPNEDEILDTVRDGLRQIDETFVITEYKFEIKQRHLTLTFKATNDSGETIDFVAEKSNGSSASGSDEDLWLIRALADLVEVTY